MAVVFIVVASAFNLAALRGFYQPLSNQRPLGGPEPETEEALLSAAAPLNLTIAYNPEEMAGFVIVDGSFLSADNSIAGALPNRDGLMVYKVQSGDNLSKIAANFGISVNTLFWANPDLNRRSFLRVGQELVILPVSGVLHKVKKGETLRSIAAAYGVNANQIIKQNRQISVGSFIIIPGTRLPRTSSFNYRPPASLPNLKNYFAAPAVGWNWGRLHAHNAVDIANACGTAVYAAAKGVVERITRGWSGGYGNSIVIRHPNNTSTRYAHLRDAVVERGQFVVQGDLVGHMGNTGNTHGPTGCHLHFEVHGAQNPFAKR